MNVASLVSEMIAGHISAKDYEGALAQFDNSNVESKELDALRLFLEVHLINLDRRKGNASDDYLIENGSLFRLAHSRKKLSGEKTRRRKKPLRLSFYTREKKVKRENKRGLLSPEELVEEDRRALSLSLEADSRIVDMKRLFWAETGSLDGETMFITENKKYVHGVFDRLRLETKFEYIKRIIILTEEKVLHFLAKKFDLDVFAFLGSYLEKRVKFIKEIAREKYEFMLRKEYLERLGYTELLALFEFFRETHVLKYAIKMNPFIYEGFVKAVFNNKTTTMDFLSSRELITRLLEIRYIGPLYALFADRTDFLTDMMASTRKSSRKPSCAVPHSRSRRTKRQRLEIVTKTII